MIYDIKIEIGFQVSNQKSTEYSHFGNMSLYVLILYTFNLKSQTINKHILKSIQKISNIFYSLWLRYKLFYCSINMPRALHKLNAKMEI